MKAGSSVIEIGFGNGREIPRVLSQSTDVTYLGLDISDTMVADATPREESGVSLRIEVTS